MLDSLLSQQQQQRQRRRSSNFGSSKCRRSSWCFVMSIYVEDDLPVSGVRGAAPTGLGGPPPTGLGGPPQRRGPGGPAPASASEPPRTLELLQQDLITSVIKLEELKEIAERCGPNPPPSPPPPGLWNPFLVAPQAPPPAALADRSLIARCRPLIMEVQNLLEKHVSVPGRVPMSPGSASSSQRARPY